MENTIAKEAELGRENRIVISKGFGFFSPRDINKAIEIIASKAKEFLKLRTRSNGEVSPITGGGRIIGNVMELSVTIPLDTRYSQRYEKEFNEAWSNAMRWELGVVSGGYVSLEDSPAIVENVKIVLGDEEIEIDMDIDEVKRRLGLASDESDEDEDEDSGYLLDYNDYDEDEDEEDIW